VKKETEKTAHVPRKRIEVESAAEARLQDIKSEHSKAVQEVEDADIQRASAKVVLRPCGSRIRCAQEADRREATEDRQYGSGTSRAGIRTPQASQDVVQKKEDLDGLTERHSFLLGAANQLSEKSEAEAAVLTDLQTKLSGSIDISMDDFKVKVES